jgi:hypothetical protein
VLIEVRRDGAIWRERFRILTVRLEGPSTHNHGEWNDHRAKLWSRQNSLCRT